MHTSIHTVHSYEWSSEGRVDKPKPLPPVILLFWPSQSFINLSFLPLTPFTLSFCFLHLHHCISSHSESLCISVFNFCSSFKYHPLSVFLRVWFPRYSSPSASSLLRGLSKQTASSKWNLKLNSDLWAFHPRENFHQERQLYTLADAHTQAHRETPSNVHVNTHNCVYTDTEIFLSVSWDHIFFTAKHYPCVSCVLQLWMLFVPVPNCRMKATELSGLFSRAK